MAGAEAVEEVQEGHLGLQGSQMGHQGHIHGFLDRVGGQHGEAGLTAGHHVGMVAEDGQGMIGQGTGRHVEHTGQQLAGDLVHIGDHQQQALGSREGGGQRARRQRAVYGARGARLGLHLRYADLLAKQVFAPVGAPLIHKLRHRRGGCNRIDSGHIAKCVRDMAGGGIAVNGHLGAQWDCLL